MRTYFGMSTCRMTRWAIHITTDDYYAIKHNNEQSLSDVWAAYTLQTHYAPDKAFGISIRVLIKKENKHSQNPVLFDDLL